MSSPYENLPARAFWRSAIGRPDQDAVHNLYVPKFRLDQSTPLMTAGSCFAQHIHRALSRNDWAVLQGEDMSPYLPTKLCHRYGYNLFSARYGNIYTARQLRQLVRSALSDKPSPTLIWEKDGRYYDALRPGVEPEGLEHPDHVRQSRTEHLRAVRQVLEEAEVIIFTLGLTECWLDRSTSQALPTAPGTIAGTYTPEEVAFHNFTHAEVLSDLQVTRDLMRTHGLNARFLLTVSPVPLAATASGKHVGPASTYSKSVLRAVCGQLQDQDDDFDYFPSYEIVTTPVAGGPYFADDMRQPTDDGVQTAISVFASSHLGDTPPKPVVRQTASAPPNDADDEAVCEDILLEAFRP